jgi:two-component system, chemotaxis family, protein-glutamate methylesterase/glutaminase
MANKIRVLIVDDSALMRQALTALLQRDRQIEVVGVAADPIIAEERIKALAPDVLTLDVEMPRMDGLTFLEKLMRSHPMPVVMVSSLTEAGCETALRALELGAVDIITKPKVDLREHLDELAFEVGSKIKAAALARIRPPEVREASQSVGSGGGPRPAANAAMIKTTDRLIAVGASTGGTEALKDFLMAMPANTPGIVIVQHMPEKFTRSFAERCDQLCTIRVKEAEEGDRVLVGHALIAPGNFHMTVGRNGAQYYVTILSAAPVNRHRPSVDVLFDSVAESAGRNAVGVIMTGMGADGAQGLLRMRRAGARTIAQDESTCVVFGMPKEAIELGAAETVLPLPRIAGAALEMAS